MATSVLVSLIVLLSFYGLQVDGKVDRYAFNIVENGTSFNEQIEVDVENKTEVFRVPQHNNVNAVEIMNDFNSGLSARRLPASQDCYVSKLDSSFPSPAKLKADMDQASKQSLPDEVTTERTGWRVVGFALRSALPEKILDFCGSLPIYNVEAVPLDSMNATMHRDSSHGRRKRDHITIEYDACSGSDKTKMNKCLTKHKGDMSKIGQTCRFDTILCFYRAKCTHAKKKGVTSYAAKYKCKGVHKVDYTGVCCTPNC